MMTTETTEERPYWDPPPTVRDDLDEVDTDALDLAIQLTLDNDREFSQTVRAYLKEDDWWGAATFAAYCRQIDHLQLSSAETPPCHIDADEVEVIIARGPVHNHEYGGAQLLRKMIAAGISKFHPQPIDALANAKRKRK